MAAELLERFGETYSEEIGIDLAGNTPNALFQWLVATMLFSIRIRAEAAVSAAKALFDHGWTTPEKMKSVTWEERVRVLNRAGYARYDESTSTKLANAASRVLENYNGDLRNLREEAKRDPVAEQSLIKQFKGIGDVGAGIFCREAQMPWPELYPFADNKALAAARTLGLGETTEDLARLIGRQQFPRLVAALVRANLLHITGLKEA